MFSIIAPKYDLLNRLLSGFNDIRWRRFAVEWLPVSAKIVVDIGTGTGDFAFAVLDRCSEAKVNFRRLKSAPKCFVINYGLKTRSMNGFGWVINIRIEVRSVVCFLLHHQLRGATLLPCEVTKPCCRKGFNGFSEPNSPNFKSKPTKFWKS
jgi:hypothetical protein